MLKVKSYLRTAKTVFFATICYASMHTLEATWSTPVAISSTPSDLPDLVVDVSGNAVAVWQGYDESNYVIQASVLPKNGSWSTPTTLSDSGQDAQSPEVGTDKSGNAVAIWSRFDGMNSIIQSSKKPFSGSWTSSVNVSDGGQNADSPELAMDFSGDVGNAVAVWHRFNGSNFVIQASTLPSGGNWSAAANISASGQDALIPEVSVDPSGNVVACYMRYDGTNFATRSATKLDGQSWSPSNILSVGGNAVNSQTTAVDASGNAITVWSEYHDTNHVIQAAYLPFGGSWSASVDLSALDKDSFEPIVVLAPSGNATAMWIEFDGSNYIAQAATLPLGGSWSAPVNLSATGQDVSYINIDVDTTGNVVAVWDRSNGTESVVQAATLPLNGSWSSATTISTPDQYAFFPKVSLNAGNVTAAWLESNGTYNVITGATLAFGQ